MTVIDPSTGQEHPMSGSHPCQQGVPPDGIETVAEEQLAALRAENARLLYAISHVSIHHAGSTYLVASAYSSVGHQFGFQLSKLQNPKAERHQYDPIPGTFGLTVLDVLGKFDGREV